VRAAVYQNGKRVGHISERLLTHIDPVENLALGKPVTSSVASGPFFCAERLTDGGTGNLDYYLGYPTQSEPIVITVDLGESQKINQIVVHEYTAGKSWEEYEVTISDEGKSFAEIGKSAPGKKQGGAITFEFPRTSARLLRIKSRGHRNQVFSSFSRLTEIQAFDL